MWSRRRSGEELDGVSQRCYCVGPDRTSVVWNMSAEIKQQMNVIGLLWANQSVGLNTRANWTRACVSSVCWRDQCWCLSVRLCYASVSVSHAGPRWPAVAPTRTQPSWKRFVPVSCKTLLFLYVFCSAAPQPSVMKEQPLSSISGDNRSCGFPDCSLFRPPGCRGSALFSSRRAVFPLLLFEEGLVRRVCVWWCFTVTQKHVLLSEGSDAQKSLSSFDFPRSS